MVDTAATVSVIAGNFSDVIQITATYIYDSPIPSPDYQFPQIITRYFKKGVGILKLIYNYGLNTDIVELTYYSLELSDKYIPLSLNNTWIYQWDRYWGYDQVITEEYKITSIETPEEIVGCTSIAACNYNHQATSSCSDANNDGWQDCCLKWDCNQTCGGTVKLDECGVCGGNGVDADDDGICDDVDDCVIEDGASQECGCNTGISEGTCDCNGNVDLGCGCFEPASLSYCIDTDTDSLGAGDSTYYCLADLPTGWVEDCTDLEPDCATNDTDECGVCGGDGPEEGFDCDGEPLSLFNGLIPEDFSIHSIYPNPFNPITSITYGLPEHVNVQILVYDLSGKQIVALINEFQAPGYHSVNWNADNLPSGVYLIRMDSGEFIQTQKVVLVK